MTSLTAQIATPFRDAAVQVTLPPGPWGLTTQAPDPRPETAPRRGVVSPRTTSRVDAAIAAIRAEHRAWRAGA